MYVCTYPLQTIRWKATANSLDDNLLSLSSSDNVQICLNNKMWNKINQLIKEIRSYFKYCRNCQNRKCRQYQYQYQYK